jgi:hypothetical protein
MGHADYDVGAKLYTNYRSAVYTKSVDQIFTQQKLRQIHDSMSPLNLDKRECRDSENHPNSLPIILSLDVTGSMGHIPHDLIKDSLPTLMGSLIQNGSKDASLLFMAVGDHECDHYPLQVGQFESGDKELDLWLTRTYIEGGGGGNSGESYLLAWYIAANHTATDAFEKRKQKGFLFTVGDEPCLKALPKSVREEIMGKTARGQASGAEELLEAAQKMYNVYHLHIMQGSAGRNSLGFWKTLLGQKCIQVDNYTDLPKVISKIVTGSDEIIDLTKIKEEAKEKAGAETVEML